MIVRRKNTKTRIVFLHKFTTAIFSIYCTKNLQQQIILIQQHDSGTTPPQHRHDVNNLSRLRHGLDVGLVVFLLFLPPGCLLYKCISVLSTSLYSTGIEDWVKSYIQYMASRVLHLEPPAPYSSPPHPSALLLLRFNIKGSSDDQPRYCCCCM